MVRAAGATWALLLAAAGLAAAVLAGMDAAQAQPVGGPPPQVCCIYLIF